MKKHLLVKAVFHLKQHPSNATAKFSSSFPFSCVNLPSDYYTA